MILLLYKYVNPFASKSDGYVFSLCNISTLSSRLLMRIKKFIT